MRVHKLTSILEVCEHQRLFMVTSVLEPCWLLDILEVCEHQRLFMVTSVLEPCWLLDSIKLIGYGTEKSVGYEVQPIGNQECAKKN